MSILLQQDQIFHPLKLDNQSIIKIAVELSYPLLVKMSVIYYDNNTCVCLGGGE